MEVHVKKALKGLAALCMLIGTGYPWGIEMSVARAEEPVHANARAIEDGVDSLKQLLPDQAHGMTDVDYHFANLWFAAQNGNWPLAEFYLGETRSHLNWVVRMRPVRRLAAGGEIDLRPILKNLENSTLADARTAIGMHDLKAFETAYRGTMLQCYGCHVAAEKPYLRLRIPELPATRMIDLKGQPN
jgi:hypothetical protein